MMIPTRRARRESVGRAVLMVMVVLATSVLALAQDLQSQLTAAIREAPLPEARIGVLIRDLGDETVLAQQRSDETYIPASNQKLFTTGTALRVLGADFVFRTELVLVGDRLVVRGSGDPALADPVLLDRMDPKMTVGDVLGVLGGAVAKADVKRVAEIVVDDRVFDREFVHPGWPSDQLHRHYCAQVCGINFYTNLLAVYPRPSKRMGQPPSIATEPSAPWFFFENRARTVSKGANRVDVRRATGTNRFILSGQVAVPTRVPVRVTVDDGAMYFGRLLAESLRSRGVEVGTHDVEADGVRLTIPAVRRPKPNERFDDGTVLAVVTTRLADILPRCNTDSNNLYGEALIKRIGHEITGQPGSWANGASVIRMTIAELVGPEHTVSTVISDGSGLSRDNRVSPETLVAWLDAMQRQPETGELFVGSLATPGTRTGTLRKRFKTFRLGNTLRAKSGSIRGVVCLSGYVTSTKTGRRVAFSILINQEEDSKRSINVAQAWKLEELIVGVVDRWVTKQDKQEAAMADAPTAGG